MSASCLHVCACVWLCVGGRAAVDWICSEMHFELMEANSCLTVLQSDVVVGEKGPGRNVKRSADSPSAMSWKSGSIYISLFIDLFISFLVGLSACHFIYTSGGHEAISGVLL